MALRKPLIHISTAAAVIFRIALIIGATESLIMLYFNVVGINPLGTLAAFFDALLLIFIASPLLYFFVIRPYITDCEEQHSAVEFLAHYDDLTKLYNRRMFDEYLKRCLPSLARHEIFGALIYLDLDEFKPITTSYSHVFRLSAWTEDNGIKKQYCEHDDINGCQRSRAVTRALSITALEPRSPIC